jgi:hypothetical protein
VANSEQLERLKASIAEHDRCRAWNLWRHGDWDDDAKKYWIKIDLLGVNLSFHFNHDRVIGHSREDRNSDPELKVLGITPAF